VTGCWRTPFQSEKGGQRGVRSTHINQVNWKGKKGGMGTGLAESDLHHPSASEGDEIWKKAIMAPAGSLIAREEGIHPYKGLGRKKGDHYWVCSLKTAAGARMAGLQRTVSLSRPVGGQKNSRRKKKRKASFPTWYHGGEYSHRKAVDRRVERKIPKTGQCHLHAVSFRGNRRNLSYERKGWGEKPTASQVGGADCD